mmetsp:Transcript_65502/g.109935  ORF Transcript_65502/g.109935 Transcript_65502/m.109935 type:complete len:663 (-) Transcript_65502:75-2063(-)|eukprot:CAMPEP_0174363754 /NCGR_PEP_ID=MMETSP0811_2-20130205/70054_1 /TAXON_ID=73025 ORGANISM="Eutreptiella gymnastica-like, Strain CCMP1594" /NCGR_SAMPLE_ID=MMETSP0811_2 /ASSEMBLY_ACC=CAM_ASM_000667 /LENGTH=662 /DNA_ID=CAMNT_0015502721 /DNA_START=69 /DNA_END=2057 /DNA_ORIENTATION=+
MPSSALSEDAEERYAAQLMRNTPEYGAAWDLELWKLAQKEQFLKGLEGEKQVLRAQWGAEWDAVLEQKEAEFQKRKEELEVLAGRVHDSMTALEKQEASLVGREADLVKVESELHTMHQSKVKDLQYSAQRAIENATSNVLVERLKVAELEKTNKVLTERVNSLMEDYSGVCQDFTAYKAQDRTVGLQRQISALEKQLEIAQFQFQELQTKAQELQQSRDHYKAQLDRVSKTLQDLQEEQHAASTSKLQEELAKLERERRQWDIERALGPDQVPQWRWTALPYAAKRNPAESTPVVCDDTQQPLTAHAPPLDGGTYCGIFGTNEVRDFKNAILELIDREQNFEAMKLKDMAQQQELTKQAALRKQQRTQRKISRAVQAVQEDSRPQTRKVRAATQQPTVAQLGREKLHSRRKSRRRDIIVEWPWGSGAPDRQLQNGEGPVDMIVHQLSPVLSGLHSDSSETLRHNLTWPADHHVFPLGENTNTMGDAEEDVECRSCSSEEWASLHQDMSGHEWQHTPPGQPGPAVHGNEAELWSQGANETGHDSAARPATSTTKLRLELSQDDTPRAPHERTLNRQASEERDRTAMAAASVPASTITSTAAALSEENDVQLQNVIRNRQQLVGTGVYTPQDAMIKDMDLRIAERRIQLQKMAQSNATALSLP